MKDIAKTYSPKEFEKKIYDFWMDKKYYETQIDPDKKPFSIAMPPPNVTGNLHLGHAMYVLQDILIRWKRMDGYAALWIPGYDHASIATEARVVNKLKSEGKTKEEIGRESFLEEAWDWTRTYGGNIRNQMEKLGFLPDWSREAFTLDEDRNTAVNEAFVSLYEKGLIYKGNRIINWCPDCLTSISDIEVEHEESKESKIWYFKYPIVGRDDYIEVATTRPETILGDLAVAVNPDDDRYTDLIGKKVILPLMDREIPIIADSYVDKDFGTGAVKITPSHDPNDFEVGQRHDLGQCLIMDDYAKINENGGKYQGQDRYLARENIINDFKELGLFVKEETITNSIGHCQRCDTVVEPIISEQWFVKMQELADNTLKEFNENQSPEFVPNRFGHIYKQWLEDIRDWNISRQLWWGHRLPVYYSSDGQMVVARQKPEDTDDITWTQEEDTLDTWFSSALWPFSILGWPDETEDLEYFYPTDVLVTGYDIIFFWVVRMVFSGIEYTGQVPFDRVLITGMVNDSQGRKMSKSLDNGVDPLDVVDKYGADALRFFLVNGNTPGNDMRYFEERVEAARNFANKLWNASRLVLMNLEEDTQIYEIDQVDLKEEDKWILHRLNKTIKEIDQRLDKLEIGLYSSEIYEFIWNEFCDWYLEVTKTRLYSDDKRTKDQALSVLVYVLEASLKLLHPIMPFITEEIYSYMPNTKSEALVVAEFPKYLEDFNFEKEYREFEFAKDIIRSIRNIRSEMNIANKKKTNTIYICNSEEEIQAIENNIDHIKQMGYSSEVSQGCKEDLDLENYLVLTVGRSEILLPLDEMIDKEKEIQRLEKEIAKTNEEISRAESKLANEGFVNKAPEKLVEEEKQKLETFKTALENLENQLKTLQ